jgi:hypothetical protein
MAGGHQCGRVGLERMVSESNGIYPQLFSPKDSLRGSRTSTGDEAGGRSSPNRFRKWDVILEPVEPGRVREVESRQGVFGGGS